MRMKSEAKEKEKKKESGCMILNRIQERLRLLCDVGGLCEVLDFFYFDFTINNLLLANFIFLMPSRFYCCLEERWVRVRVVGSVD